MKDLDKLVLVYIALLHFTFSDLELDYLQTRPQKYNKSTDRPNIRFLFFKKTFILQLGDSTC